MSTADSDGDDDRDRTLNSLDLGELQKMLVLPVTIHLTFIDDEPLIHENEDTCDKIVHFLDTPNRTFISMMKKLWVFSQCLANLTPSTAEHPELALDSEGYDLPTTLTVLQLKIRSTSHIYVFHVKRLGGNSMFDVEGSDGVSLRKVLQGAPSDMVGCPQ